MHMKMWVNISFYFALLVLVLFLTAAYRSYDGPKASVNCGAAIPMSLSSLPSLSSPFKTWIPLTCDRISCLAR
ncbi:hypothetical protein BJ741DRAFT_632719 [Chytriomyces cf. hyalinus JEL632]|nr:hypothetical protein BJ741DRAFT_632719 [Chytriomyces cf. hyalinus JEL632]